MLAWVGVTLIRRCSNSKLVHLHLIITTITLSNHPQWLWSLSWVIMMINEKDEEVCDNDIDNWPQWWSKRKNDLKNRKFSPSQRSGQIRVLSLKVKNPPLIYLLMVIFQYWYNHLPIHWYHYHFPSTRLRSPSCAKGPLRRNIDVGEIMLCLII